jgi:hypothetical protein
MTDAACPQSGEYMTPKVPRSVAVNRRGVPGEHRAIPNTLKGIVALFLVVLGLLGVFLLPAAFAGGWTSGITVVAALGLIVGAVIECVRIR